VPVFTICDLTNTTVMSHLKANLIFVSKETEDGDLGSSKFRE